MREMETGQVGDKIDGKTFHCIFTSYAFWFLKLVNKLLILKIKLRIVYAMVYKTK